MFLAWQLWSNRRQLLIPHFNPLMLGGLYHVSSEPGPFWEWNIRTLEAPRMNEAHPGQPSHLAALLISRIKDQTFSNFQGQNLKKETWNWPWPWVGLQVCSQMTLPSCPWVGFCGKVLRKSRVSRRLEVFLIPLYSLSSSLLLIPLSVNLMNN